MITVEEAQRQHDMLMHVLIAIKDNGSGYLPPIIGWLDLYQNVADRIGVVKDPAVVINALEDLGFVSGELCGQPPEFYENSINLGRWLVGQCLDGLYTHGCPHQVMHKFVDDYFELKAKEDPDV